jgi:hypothetical protein
VARAADRRIHLLCVGAPKTGTHSVAGLFARSFRSEHEPDVEQLIEAAVRYLQGGGEDQIVEFLRARDRALNLEVESSNPLGVLVPLLVGAFPGARFVITIREPLDWLRSEINSHLLTGPESAYWVAAGQGAPDPWPGPARAELWRRLRFGHESDSQLDVSRHLVRLGLFPVEGYLTYWACHYRACLAAIAVGRALVVSTRRLTAGAASLARFAGVDPQLLDYSASHSFAAPARAPLLSELDSAGVLEAAERICGPIRRAYQQIEDGQECAPAGSAQNSLAPAAGNQMAR